MVAMVAIDALMICSRRARGDGGVAWRANIWEAFKLKMGEDDGARGLSAIIDL